MKSPQRNASGRVSGDSTTPVLKYRPQGETIAKFHQSKEFIRGLVGPLGSGKTYGAILDIINRCHNQTPDRNNVRDSRWCIARNTFPDLNAATIPDVRAVVDQINPDGWNMTAPISWRHEYRRKNDGSTVKIELMFRSFDGPQDTKKARGMQLSGAWVDEAAEFNKENFDMLIGRVKRYPAKVKYSGTGREAKFHFIFTSNACARDHWMAKLALTPIKPAGWHIGVQPGGVIKEGNTWVENPLAENLANLPKSYYIEQCGGKKESWIRQNLANEFVVHTDGRPIHPGFNERLHVQASPPIPGIPVYIGIDFGRTPAAVIAQKQFGTWRICKELVTYNMGADRFAPILVKMLNEEFSGYEIAEITGDPAGSQMAQTRDETPFDLLAAGGIHALPASTNDPEIRYATLDNLLGQLVDGEPAITIDPSCEILIRGLAGEYQFRRLQVANREEYRDTPDKGPTSHVVESLHYMLMGAGEDDQLFDQTWMQEYSDVDSWAPDDRYFE